MKTTEIEKLYSLRKDFTVIGITGRRGAGCLEAAEIITKDFKTNIRKGKIRNPTDLKDLDTNHIFNRKYKIVFNYAEENWKKYKVLYYRDIVLLHLTSLTNEEILDEIIQVYENADYGFEIKIDENIKYDISNLLDKYKENNEEIRNLLIDSKNKKILKITEEKELIKLYNSYFGNNGFEEFAKKFYAILDNLGISQRINLTHRLGNNLRGSGNPKTDNPRYKNLNTPHL